MTWGVDIVFDLVFLLQGPKHQNMVFTGKTMTKASPGQKPCQVKPKTMAGLKNIVFPR